MIADFDASRAFSLLDMVGFENRLSDLLGAPVDLSPSKMLKEPIRERAMREGCVPFREPDLALRDISMPSGRGIGNWRRHQYDRIDLETVWKTVTDELPQLKSSVESALMPPTERNRYGTKSAFGA